MIELNVTNEELLFIVDEIHHVDGQLDSACWTDLSDDEKMRWINKILVDLRNENADIPFEKLFVEDWMEKANG